MDDTSPASSGFPEEYDQWGQHDGAQPDSQYSQYPQQVPPAGMYAQQTSGQPSQQRPYRQQASAPGPQCNPGQSPYQPSAHPRGSQGSTGPRMLYQAPYGGVNQRPAQQFQQPMRSVPYQTFQPAKRSDNRPVVAVGIIVGAIAFFLVLVIVGCVAVFGAFKPQVDNAIANASDSALEDLRARGYDPDTYIDADGRVQDQKVYHYAQSEDFERYDAAVRAMLDKYQGMSDEEVIDILPEKSEEAVMQYGAFLMILTDLKSANRFGDSRTTTDPQEITDYYNAQIAYINDLEQRFLKGKALGTTVRIKKSDGTYFEVDGDEDPAYKKPDDVKTVAVQWEEKIKAVPIGLGADGTYLQTGEALVQSVGLTATYDYQSVFDHCTRGRLSNEQTLAAYCSATQNMIYINQGSSNFANDVRDSYYPNAVKHELAHAMIHRICGSTAPPVGVDVEALTNSYTVLYFGGDYDQLQSGAQNAPWYQMTDASHEAAKAVHNGQCKVS